MSLDRFFIEIIVNGALFVLGYIFCVYLKKKYTPLGISKDPMVFNFHLIESGEYVLNVTGMEGRHLVKENHKRFIELLKFIYENEKLRTFPKERQFKLLTFEKKE